MGRRRRSAGPWIRSPRVQERWCNVILYKMCMFARICSDDVGANYVVHPSNKDALMDEVRMFVHDEAAALRAPAHEAYRCLHMDGAVLGIELFFVASFDEEPLDQPVIHDACRRFGVAGMHLAIVLQQLRPHEHCRYYYDWCAWVELFVAAVGEGSYEEGTRFVCLKFGFRHVAGVRNEVRYPGAQGGMVVPGSLDVPSERRALRLHRRLELNIIELSGKQNQCRERVFECLVRLPGFRALELVIVKSGPPAGRQCSTCFNTNDNVLHSSDSELDPFGLGRTAALVLERQHDIVQLRADLFSLDLDHLPRSRAHDRSSPGARPVKRPPGRVDHGAVL